MRTLSRAERIVSVVVGSVILLVAATGCDDPPSATPSSQADARTTAEQTAVAPPRNEQSKEARVAWSRKLDVIGQPVEVGPAVLVLARAGGTGVELVSLDRATGRQNFTMPFHPGGLPTGVVMTPKATETDTGRHLAIVRRYEIGAPGPALVAVDVQTGAIVGSVPQAVDDYDACSDGHDVCWSGYDGGSDKFGPLSGGGPTRWDLESGRLLENDGQDAARLVGSPDLYVRGEGRTSVIARLQGSQRTRWTQSVSLAVAPGVDPSYGWSFEHDEEANVYTGSMGKPFPAKLVRQFEQGKRVEFSHRSRYLTVGIDGRTGEQLWSRKGANPWCHLIRSTPETRARTLCVMSGSRINEEGREAKDRDLAVELQGVDPRTGDVTWSFRLEGDAATRAFTDKLAPISPFGVVLPTSDGPVALDERNGALERVDDETVLFCPTGPDHVTAYGASRSAGTLYRTCTPDGRRVKLNPSLFGVAALEGEGRARIVSMPGRVVAFRLP